MNQRAPSHEEIRSLLAAYALHAVSPTEDLMVAEHLESCEECALETQMLQETAAALAVIPSSTALPEGFVDRVMDVIPPPRRQVGHVLRTLAAVAAAALIAVGAAGVLYNRERDQGRAFEVLMAQAEEQVTFERHEGFTGEGRLYIAGDRAALALKDVPDPGADRVYQLWTLEDGVAIPMDVFRPSDGRVAIVMDLPRRGQVFAVTVEPAGGSTQPTTAPILSGA